MAKIILLSQKVTKKELLDSIQGKKIGKIFFQCVLNSLVDDVATFGILAYAAKKEKPGGFKNWLLGTPVYCVPGPTIENREFDPATFNEPIAFGNMEVKLKFEQLFGDIEEEKKNQLNPKELKMSEFIHQLNKLSPDKELHFKGDISKNPHVEYTVTIGGVGDAQANPCPPFDPGE